jgi:hypothetical protein
MQKSAGSVQTLHHEPSIPHALVGGFASCSNEKMWLFTAGSWKGYTGLLYIVSLLLEGECHSFCCILPCCALNGCVMVAMMVKVWVFNVGPRVLGSSALACWVPSKKGRPLELVAL